MSIFNSFFKSAVELVQTTKSVEGVKDVPAAEKTDKSSISNSIAENKVKMPVNELDKPIGKEVGKSPISNSIAENKVKMPVNKLDKPIGKEVTNNFSPEDAKLKEIAEEYIDDLLKKSEYPETIDPIDTSDLERKSPGEIASQREEFAKVRQELKHEWEEKNGQPWPKYEHDVYSSKGNLIRRAGSDYDAHHIKPLSAGGKNEAGNITPLNAEVHYDKQGIHAPDSPCTKLDKYLGGQNA